MKENRIRKFLIIALVVSLLVINVSNVCLAEKDLVLNIIDFDPIETLLKWPTRSTRVTGFFGDSRDGGARLHAGIDIGLPDPRYDTNERIYAAADGKVIYVGFYGSAGYTVAINSEVYPGIYIQTRYSHLKENSITVEEGDNLYKGQTIGIMGKTGGDYAIHLHYETREAKNMNAGMSSRDSIAMNPLNLYKGYIPYRNSTDSNIFAPEEFIEYETYIEHNKNESGEIGILKNGYIYNIDFLFNMSPEEIHKAGFTSIEIDKFIKSLSSSKRNSYKKEMSLYEDEIRHNLIKIEDRNEK